MSVDSQSAPEVSAPSDAPDTGAGFDDHADNDDYIDREDSEPEVRDFADLGDSELPPPRVRDFGDVGDPGVPVDPISLKPIAEPENYGSSLDGASDRVDEEPEDTAEAEAAAEPAEEPIAEAEPEVAEAEADQPVEPEEPAEPASGEPVDPEAIEDQVEEIAEDPAEAVTGKVDDEVGDAEHQEEVAPDLGRTAIDTDEAGEEADETDLAEPQAAVEPAKADELVEKADAAVPPEAAEELVEPAVEPEEPSGALEDPAEANAADNETEPAKENVEEPVDEAGKVDTAADELAEPVDDELPGGDEHPEDELPEDDAPEDEEVKTGEVEPEAADKLPDVEDDDHPDEDQAETDLPEKDSPEDDDHPETDLSDDEADHPEAEDSEVEEAVEPETAATDGLDGRDGDSGHPDESATGFEDPEDKDHPEELTTEKEEADTTATEDLGRVATEGEVETDADDGEMKGENPENDEEEEYVVDGEALTATEYADEIARTGEPVEVDGQLVEEGEAEGDGEAEELNYNKLSGYGFGGDEISEAEGEALRQYLDQAKQEVLPNADLPDEVEKTGDQIDQIEAIREAAMTYANWLGLDVSDRVPADASGYHLYDDAGWDQLGNTHNTGVENGEYSGHTATGAAVINDSADDPTKAVLGALDETIHAALVNEYIVNKDAEGLNLVGQKDGFVTESPDPLEQGQYHGINDYLEQTIRDRVVARHWEDHPELEALGDTSSILEQLAGDTDREAGDYIVGSIADATGMPRSDVLNVLHTAMLTGDNTMLDVMLDYSFGEEGADTIVNWGQPEGITDQQLVERLKEINEERTALGDETSPSGGDTTSPDAPPHTTAGEDTEDTSSPGDGSKADAPGESHEPGKDLTRTYRYTAGQEQTIRDLARVFGVSNASIKDLNAYEIAQVVGRVVDAQLAKGGIHGDVTLDVPNWPAAMMKFGDRDTKPEPSTGSDTPVEGDGTEAGEGGEARGVKSSRMDPRNDPRLFELETPDGRRAFVHNFKVNVDLASRGLTRGEGGIPSKLFHETGRGTPPVVLGRRLGPDEHPKWFPKHHGTAEAYKKHLNGQIKNGNDQERREARDNLIRMGRVSKAEHKARLLYHYGTTKPKQELDWSKRLKLSDKERLEHRYRNAPQWLRELRLAWFTVLYL